jgi:hypothetical protein
MGGDDGPRRVALAPGVRAVRLGRGLVQVGLEHARAVRLPRSPETDAVLAAAAHGDTVPDTAAARLLTSELLDRGLAVPAAASSRCSTTVAVVGRAGADPVALLEASGLTTTTDADRADLVLLASSGELDRDLLTPLVRARQPHLPVRLVDGIALVGPFSVPGRSACLRCVDLHRAVDDAAHVLLVERYARSPGGATDPVLGTLATAWAVRDLATWATGGCPSTWSRTVRIDPALGEVSAQSWWRHPECGCTWGQDLSATMEA